MAMDSIKQRFELDLSAVEQSQVLEILKEIMSQNRVSG
jgi:hypothetical protein